MSLLEICQNLQNSNWGTEIRESIFFFPIIDLFAGVLEEFEADAIGVENPLGA